MCFYDMMLNRDELLHLIYLEFLKLTILMGERRMVSWLSFPATSIAMVSFTGVIITSTVLLPAFTWEISASESWYHLGVRGEGEGGWRCVLHLSGPVPVVLH